MSRIQQDLFELIQSKTGVLPQVDDTFDALKIDSLAMAELTVEMEKAFGIRIGDDIVNVATIPELVQYIEQKSRDAGAP